MKQSPPSDRAPLVALVFKVMMEEGRKLSYARIYSGRLLAGDEVLNPAKKKKEKIARILAMHANKRQRINEARAGNIVGIIGLKASGTGDTLCDPSNPIILEPIEAYEPVGTRKRSNNPLPSSKPKTPLSGSSTMMTQAKPLSRVWVSFTLKSW